MELKDFVAATLQQLIDGVAAAGDYALHRHAEVNPRGVKFEQKQRVFCEREGAFELVQEVEFDVAVTTLEGGAKKGGIGVFVGGVGLGAQRASRAESTSESRIRFSVPILLPRSRPVTNSEQ